MRRGSISRSLMRYHPRIGYTYMPSTKLRVQGPNGGYLVRTNSEGFRSDREFLSSRTAGVFRALVFGDSQTAGDGTLNALRFSDLLEQALPGLENYNYGLSGTGTDQQFLTYQEHRSVDHDLVVIGLYVENIRRNSRRILKSRDASGEELFRAKPYYEIQRGELVLRNVPVPKQAWTEETLPKEQLAHVYAYGGEYSFFRDPSRHRSAMLRRLVPAGPLRQAAKTVVRRGRKFQPLPEYSAPDSPDWLLLRKILTTWIAESRTPVLLLLIPHETALMKSSDPRNYQRRFHELAKDTGCHVFDPLRDLLRLDAAERGGLWSSAYGHLSVQGHEAIARLLVPVLQNLMNAVPPSDAGADTSPVSRQR
jgi:hypothetical protein